LYRIFIRRDCEVKAPYSLCLENINDYTHFTHLHRKAILEYRLLYKLGNREIFLYKARRLYPFPFYDTYVVFREYVKADGGYSTLYLNVRSGAVHHLKGWVVDHGETCSIMGDFVFTLPSFWRLFPKLFFWVFKRRMKAIFDEDCQWFKGRMAEDASPDSPGCAPYVPETYDLFLDLFKNDTVPAADIKFHEKVSFDPKEASKKGY
jgi:hypothetical protein